MRLKVGDILRSKTVSHYLYQVMSIDEQSSHPYELSYYEDVPIYSIKPYNTSYVNDAYLSTLNKLSELERLFY